MSDTPDETHNGTQNRPTVQFPPNGASNSMSALSEDLQKTLEEAELHVNQQMNEAQGFKADPEAVLRERERAIAEALEKAKNFYRKSEYGHAFGEWEKVCAFLGENDRFRRKICELRDSHESLIKVNQELSEIKQVLTQRSSPPPAETKFVDEAQDVVNAQVKNVYSYLNQQLRTERTPRGISFWWPVALAAVILLLGFIGLKGYFMTAQRQLSSQESSLSAKTDPLGNTYLEAQKNAIQKQISVLNQDHENQMEGLRRKHAEASKNDRERIIQLETKLRETESKISELERQSQALLEDNINKDKTIAALN